MAKLDITLRGVNYVLEDWDISRVEPKDWVRRVEVADSPYWDDIMLCWQREEQGRTRYRFRPHGVFYPVLVHAYNMMYPDPAFAGQCVIEFLVKDIKAMQDHLDEFIVKFNKMKAFA